MLRKLSLSAFVLASLLATGCAAMGGDAPAKAADGVLVGANGMTLYTFDKDTAGTGKSVCNGPCANNWRSSGSSSTSRIFFMIAFRTGMAGILCRRRNADRRLKQFAIARSVDEIVCNGPGQKMASSKPADHRRPQLTCTGYSHDPSTRFQRSFIMNAKYSKFSPRRVAAIAALALGVAVTAYAMPPRDG